MKIIDSTTCSFFFFYLLFLSLCSKEKFGLFKKQFSGVVIIVISEISLYSVSFSNHFNVAFFKAAPQTLRGAFKFTSFTADGRYQFSHLFRESGSKSSCPYTYELGSRATIFLSWLGAFGEVLWELWYLVRCGRQTVGQLVRVRHHDKIIALHATPKSNHNYICKLWVNWEWKCLIRKYEAF